MSWHRRKVILSGDGGDECFGGYDRYLGQRLVDLLSTIPAAVRKPVLELATRMVPERLSYKSLGQRLRWLSELSDHTGGQRYARALGFLRFTPETKEQLFTENAKQSLTERDSMQAVLKFFESEQTEELIDRMLYSDLMTRVRDHNLVMGDRMSMAHSLEVRAPFLDPRVIEFAGSLPAHYKVRGRHLKWVLRSKLKELHQRVGATMIYVTHDQTEALTFADQVVVMHDGKIEQADTPRHLYHHPVGRATH